MCTLSPHADRQRRAAALDHERRWRPLQLLRPCTLHCGQTPALVPFPPVRRDVGGEHAIVLFFEDTQIARLPPYALPNIGKTAIAIARNFGLNVDSLNFTLQICSVRRSRPLIACAKLAGPQCIKHPFLSRDIAQLLHKTQSRAGKEALQFFRSQNERDCFFSLHRFLRQKGVTIPDDLPPKRSERWRTITGLDEPDSTFTFLLLRDEVWRVSWQIQRRPVSLGTFLSWLPEDFRDVRRAFSPKTLQPIRLQDDVQVWLSFDLCVLCEAAP